MAKKNSNSFLAALGKWFKILLLIAIILVGGYFYLKEENKLPREIENLQVEKIVNKTIDETLDETGELKDKLLDKISSTSKRTSSTNHEKRSSGKVQNIKQGSLNLKLEIPVSTQKKEEIIIKRIGYTASYNNKMKNPNWVAWELTRKETIGEEERTNKFLPDPNLPEPRVKTSDYTRTGYDRGHMAPAADMKWSEKAMEESFYMSNICPQNQKLNRGDWGDLEEACRGWAKKYGTVYIACGPIYDHARPKRIGNTKIAVPDRFFKVVLINNRKDPMALGFIFPNRAQSQDLGKYQVTVDSVEKITGYDFFAKLPDQIENAIEAKLHPLPSARR